jgi:hypothetical protein
MAVDVASVSYLLSSIASAGKIIEFAMGLKGRRPSSAEIKNLQRQADEEAKKRFQSATPWIMAMSDKMSDQIVEAIRNRMELEKAKIIKAITDPQLSTYDIEKRLSDARRDFCWAIHQVKHHNGGVLPPDLQEEWKLNLCDDYNF